MYDVLDKTTATDVQSNQTNVPHNGMAHGEDVYEWRYEPTTQQHRPKVAHRKGIPHGEVWQYGSLAGN